jgi:hypothetical protein
MAVGGAVVAPGWPRSRDWDVPICGDFWGSARSLDGVRIRGAVIRPPSAGTRHGDRGRGGVSPMTRAKRIVRTGLYLILFSALFVVGSLIYLYRHGGKDNYFPPSGKTISPSDQVMSDLTELSQAVESYNVKNMHYPKDLELLKPDFLSRLPEAPISNTFYLYETDGTNRYGIRISDPRSYNLKEMHLENGRIIKK